MVYLIHVSVVAWFGLRYFWVALVCRVQVVSYFIAGSVSRGCVGGRFVGFVSCPLS